VPNAPIPSVRVAIHRQWEVTVASGQASSAWFAADNEADVQATAERFVAAPDEHDLKAVGAFLSDPPNFLRIARGGDGIGVLNGVPVPLAHGRRDARRWRSQRDGRQGGPR
jgi:archaeosine-15-forming tRNA-guanine transglycosylase